MDQIVKDTLKDYPLTRNSDKHLILQVWSSMGLDLTPEQKSLFMNLPSAETITRCRRKIQEGGLYQASESIKKHRRIKSRIVRQRIPKTKEVQSLFDSSDYEIKRYWT